MGRRRIHAPLTPARVRGKPCQKCGNRTRTKKTHECVVCREGRNNERRKQLRRTADKDERQAIAELYEMAARLGMKVDHIVPVKHPLVCGLHVLRNLQLLTPDENIRKGNAFNERDGIAR